METEENKKILLVVESINVEGSSGAKANVALIKNLQKAGFDLRVYHYSQKEIQLNNIPCFGIPENRSSFLFLLSRTERLFRNKLKLDFHKHLENLFGFSFTLFNDRNSIRKALNTVKDFEPDLVLTLSQGGSFRPHHALLQFPKWHKKWLAYVHDPYPMHQFPKPYTWKEPGFKLREKFMEEVAQKARFSAFPSLLLLEWMGKFHPDFLKTGVVIPHQIAEIPDEEVILPDFFNPNKFSILHAGNLLSARNPMALVVAFKNFLEENPEAKEECQLLFIGPKSVYSERFEVLKKELPQLYTSEESFSFPVVLALQKAVSVNVILEAKAEVSPFLPGKFPHCVQAEKPILLLGPKKSESGRLLGEDYPFWSEIDNKERIFRLIERLYVEWKEFPKGLKMKNFNLQQYCSEIHLKNIIKRMIL